MPKYLSCLLLLSLPLLACHLLLLMLLLLVCSDLQTIALQLQNIAQWLGQIMQQRGLNSPLNVSPVAEGIQTCEPQPTLNHPTPQQSSYRAEAGSRGVDREEEPITRVHGRRVRELIDNDEVESYSVEIARRTESKEWREGYRLEKKPRQEEEDLDQKLQKMKEQLLAEIRAKDRSQTLLPTSSPFSRWIQQKTIPKKFMMPPMATYDGTGNPREHVLNFKTPFMCCNCS